MFHLFKKIYFSPRFQGHPSHPLRGGYKYEAKYVGFDKGEKSEICSVKIYDYPFFSYNPNNKNLTIYFSKNLGITGLYLSHDKTNRKPFSVDTIQDHVGKLYFDIIMGEGFYMEPKFKYYE